MAKVNKLNIYLIKHGKELEQIFKDPLDSIETISLDDGSSLYYNRKTVVVPEWVSKFFKTNFISLFGYINFKEIPVFIPSIGMLFPRNFIVVIK